MRIELQNGVIWIKGQVTETNFNEALVSGKNCILITEDIVVNLSQLENGGTVNVALLLQFMKFAKSKSKKIKFHQAPDFLLMLRKMYGLDKILSFVF